MRLNWGGLFLRLFEYTQPKILIILTTEMDNAESEYSITAFKFGIASLLTIAGIILLFRINEGFAYFAIFPLMVFWLTLGLGIIYAIMGIREKGTWRKYVSFLLNFGFLIGILVDILFK